MEFSTGFISAAYIVAALLFIFSLSGLSQQKTAETGNWYGIVGMAIALVATLLNPSVSNVALVIVMMLIGGFIGLHLAKIDS
jgi:NAD(P) transhydrogenase subunit beta